MTAITHPLRDAFVQARDSAIAEYASYLSCWSQKNPNEAEKQIAELVNRLTPDQREANKELVRYFIEAALFKLLDSLESGEGDYTFHLAARSSQTGKEEVLISDEADRDLIHEFFDWMGQ